MIRIRPLRRVDVHALALDAPLPFLPTCAGMGLPWPSGRPQEAAKGTGEAMQVLCACGNALLVGERICADCAAFADAVIGVGIGPH